MTQDSFTPRAPRAAFTEEEWEILVRYGAQLEALATGRRPPETKEQSRFLLVATSNGRLEPKTRYEKIWVKYRRVARPRLVVEMVPRGTWRDNLRSRLPREAWRTLARETARAAGGRCEVCGGTGTRHPVECHERWEYDDERHVQRLAGLVALCPACHQACHAGLAFTRGKGEEVIRHLARVNGWSHSDAKLHLEAAFEQWSRRSRHEWTLDLSWLDGREAEPPEGRADELP